MKRILVTIFMLSFALPAHARQPRRSQPVQAAPQAPAPTIKPRATGPGGVVGLDAVPYITTTDQSAVLPHSVVGSTVYVSQGGVIVTHKDGTQTTYTASANTDLARGTALTNAFAAIATYDDFRIFGGNFDLGTGTLTMLAHCSIHGDGMHKTQVTSAPASVNSVVLQYADHCLIENIGVLATDNSPSGPFVWPIGGPILSHDGCTGSTTIRNCYISGYTDGILFSGVAGNAAYYKVENNVFAGHWDDVLFSSCATGGASDPAATDIVVDFSGNVFASDGASAQGESGNSGQTLGRGIVCQCGTANVMAGNRFPVTGTSGGAAFGIATDTTGTVNVYPGNVFSMSGATVTKDISSGSSNPIAIAAGNVGSGTSGALTTSGSITRLPTSVVQGGTGLSTLTAHTVQIGNGTSSPTQLTIGTDGQLLIGQSSADPSFKTVSGDATLSALGALTVTKSNGSSFGTAAFLNSGTSGGTLGLLNAANTYSANQIYGNTNLWLQDTDASNKLNLKWNENDSADRTLSILVSGANRSLTLSGNATLGNWFDQSVKTTADVIFNSVTVPTVVLNDLGTHKLDIQSNSTYTADRTLTIATSDTSPIALVLGSGGTVLYSGGALGTPASGTATNLTGIPAAQISGVIPIANLATGTPNGSKFLADDGSLKTPSGSGTVTATGGNLTSNAVVLGAGTTDTKVVAGIITDGTSKLTLGVNTTSLGSIKMFGNTSGDLTFQPQAVAGTSTVLTGPNSSSTIPIITQQITVSGPSAARTWTVPDASFTVARTDAANTFTGHQTIEGVTSTGATGTGLLVFGTSPTLTTAVLGSSTATTQSAADNSTKVATTAYADAGVTADRTATVKLTSHRVKKRVVSVSYNANPTYNTDNGDVFQITVTGNITSLTTNLSGTPDDEDVIQLEFVADSGGPYTISGYGAKFAANGKTTLFTTLPASKTTTALFKWSAAKSEWILFSADDTGF